VEGDYWESTLIMGRLHDSQGRNSKFYPIFFDTPNLSIIPDGIRTSYFDLSGYDLFNLDNNEQRLKEGGGYQDLSGRVKSLRRRFQKLRKELQEAQKTRKVKQLERRERRMMTQINHEISKQLVQFAKDFGMGLRLEDLSGIRQNSKQRKKTKSDAGNNRDYWAYSQLEKFTMYKAIREGVPFEKIFPAYTSKSDHRNGMIGKRVKHWFTGHDGYCCNADWNAAQNIGQWVGFACPLDLQKAVAVMAMADPGDGVNDSPLTGEESKMAALAPS
jgi:IS605 OrfB family transposase